METRFKVAAAHVAPVYLDADASVAKACDRIAEAGREGVRLLVFPEVFVPGFPYWINCYPPLLQAGLNRRYQQTSITVPGPEIARVQAAAKEAAVAVVLGISERDQGTCYNTQVFIERDGSLLGIHRKLQPTYAERFIWGQGDGSTLSVFDSSVGRLGGLACWEHTMNLARQALVLQGIQIHAAAWPSLSTMAGFEGVADAQIEALMKNHALTGQCFVVAASSPVTGEMLELMERELGPQQLTGIGGGWSAVIHPFTPCLAGPHVGAEEKLVIAEIDLAQIADVKLFVDSAGHFSRPEVLSLNFDAEEKTPLRRV
jgi:nitrilase